LKEVISSAKDSGQLYTTDRDNMPLKEALEKLGMGVKIVDGLPIPDVD